MMSLLGVKYVAGGRELARDGGLDCWGLVRVVYEKIGKGLLPEYMIDEKELQRLAFQTESEKESWVKIDRPGAHCVVLFRLNDGGWHCGVVLQDRTRFIHCRMPCVMIERLDERIWEKARKGFYRYAGK